MVSEVPGRFNSSLSLLSHRVSVLSPSEQVLTASAESDVVVVDSRSDLVGAKTICQMFASTGVIVPRLLVVAERGLSVRDHGVGRVGLHRGPCRTSRVRGEDPAADDGRRRRRTGHDHGRGIVIDERAYSVALHDRQLDLTYTEFELLNYLVQHPGRVFSREHLLTEVWGNDYYGATRTVDVHVRRLRSKLGVAREALIATVRNVGYRFSAKG